MRVSWCHHGHRLCLCGLQVTKLALDEAIKICGPGVPIREIGAKVQSIAEAHKIAVSEEFIGHGVGQVFHAAPQVGQVLSSHVCLSSSSGM